MWHTRVLGVDPVARTKELHHFDPHTGDQALELVQDVEPIVEGTKGRFNMVDERARWRDGFNHVASIPLVIVDKIRRERGVNILTDQAALKEFLNDPEHRAFRTRPGRV